jgi:hypothetical protein
LYSSKSAYEAFFLGSIKFGPWRKIWKTWAPPRCKFFIWLVLLGRVWIAGRLAKRNLPHPVACPLCDQEVETINHLLAWCAFVREVWTTTLQRFGLIRLVAASNLSGPKGGSQGTQFLNNLGGLGVMEAL